MKFIGLFLILVLISGLGIFGGYQLGHTEGVEKGKAMVTTEQCFDSTLQSVKSGVQRLVND